MRILMIGGSGFLGTILLPHIRKENWVRVLDLSEPSEQCDEFVCGSVTDLDSLSRAMEGIEGLLYLAMGRGSDGDQEDIHPCYDVNVKGLHLALQTGLDVGIQAAVYPSTMNIYESYTASYLTSEEDCHTNSPEVYGFTKWLGEEVCRYFGLRRGMRVTALRLCGPMEHERWIQATRDNGGYTLCTSVLDVADAMLKALRLPGAGYEAVFVTGDYEERQMSLQKAEKVLGWEPKARLSDVDEV